MADAKKPLSQARIAFVEDEDDIAVLVSAYLRKEGFAVERFSSGRAFLRFLEKHVPDLILLDLMLPDASGLDICRFLKEREATRAVPVIIATAKGEEPDKILGLEMGADDYVAKPYSLRELAARIRAVLRRSSGTPADAPIEVGKGLVIDLERHEVRLQGRALELTETEYRILTMLSGRPGRVFSREEILDKVWGHDKIVLDRTVDVHVKNLRDKLGPAARLIQNVRGAGYKVEP